MCSVMFAIKNEMLLCSLFALFLALTLNFNPLNSLCFEFGPRQRQELMT